MAQVPQDQWDRVYQELTKEFPSRSPLRHLGEGPVDTMAGFVLNTDGSVHVDIVAKLANYGDPEAIALLQEVASAKGDSRYPDRQHDANLAEAILATANTAPDTTVRTVQALDRPVYAVPAPAPAPAASSTGAIIGQAYDALEALQSSGVLTGDENTPLKALIGVLQTKTTQGVTA